MNFTRGITVTFLILTSPTQDELGNDIHNATTLVVPNCGFAPGSPSRLSSASRSTERVGVRDQVIDQPTVFVPTGTVLGAIDRAIVPGYGTYDIDGTPQYWPPHPASGWMPSHAIVVTLKQVTG